MACLDYLNSPHSPERAALPPPPSHISSTPAIPALWFSLITRHLPAKLRRCTFSSATRRHPYDPPRLPLDRSRIPFCDRQSCASSRLVAGSQYLECTVQSSDGPRKVCAHRKRRDRPRSRAHHLTRRRDPIRPAGERRDVWSRISRQRESAGRSAEPHRSAATEAVHQARQAGYVVRRCYLQLYGWLG